MTDSSSRGGCAGSLLWIVALVVAAGLAFTGGYQAGDRFGYHRGHSLGFRDGYTESKEARTLERNAGVRVRLGVDSDMVLDGIQDLTPEAPPEAFDASVDEIYRALVSQTARAYPFVGGHEQRALEAWDAMRPQVVGRHYRQLRSWNQSRKPLPGMRLSLDHHAISTDFATVLKDEACAVVRELWTVSTGPDEPRPLLPGLCMVVDRELLDSLVTDLGEAALARDVQVSVSEASTHYRDTIMELATAEMRIDGVVRHSYESKIFEGWLIEQTDRTSLEVRGTGIVKSGFKMHEAYDVVVLPEEHLIRVILPRAEVLSNTLVPAFSAETEGWWTSVTTKQRNLGIQALQERVERQALEDGILDEAQTRAVGLVQDLFSPLTALPNSPYRVEVQFTDSPDE